MPFCVRILVSTPDLPILGAILARPCPITVTPQRSSRGIPEIQFAHEPRVMQIARLQVIERLGVAAKLLLVESGCRFEHPVRGSWAG